MYEEVNSRPESVEVHVVDFPCSPSSVNTKPSVGKSLKKGGGRGKEGGAVVCVSGIKEAKLMHTLNGGYSHSGIRMPV